MKKLMLVAALLVFFAGQVYAADWNFYGSARVSTFKSDIETNPFTATRGNTDDYEQDINGNARIGANVKVSDTLSADFEYGSKRAENLRILWGEWDFGGGSLGVGQNYTPLLMPYSNQVYNIFARREGDVNMSLFGMLYGKRKPMVRLKFGKLLIAAVQPVTTVSMGTTTGFLGRAVPNTEVQLPSLQAKYTYETDWGHLAVAGGYQTFDVKVTGKLEHQVTSYVLAVGGRVNIGKAYLKGNLWGGQNVGNIADILVGGHIYSTGTGAVGTTPLDGASLGFAYYNNAGNGLVTDNDALASLIVAGYEIRKGLYVEAGYGYTRTELNTAGAVKDDANTWYIQSTIFLAPGVFVTPEIGSFDGNSATDPYITYYGIKWQINF